MSAESRCILPVLLLCTAGCAGLQPVQPLTDYPVEIASVPFYPQTTDQCGPAALTSALQFSGADVTFEQIRERVYVPERAGSLQLELLAASRGANRLPVRVPTTAPAVIALLQSGRPVLVMQNLGVAFLPLWHFAVVVGYLPESDRFVLRSGADSRRLMSRRAFEASWDRAERWGIVLFAASEQVQGVDLLAYLDEAAALESLGKPALAQQAYRRATESWPEASLPQLGLGNSYYGDGQLESARRAYTRALALDPGSLVARNNLAHVLGEIGCPVRALALLDAAPATGSGAILDQQLATTRFEIESALAQSGDRCQLPAPGPASGPAPDFVLEGVLQSADHQTYRELAFEMPSGIGQLRVIFSYDRSEGTVIDLGLRDPERFRGWSGGNKQTFTIGESQATPSYLFGPLPAGTWHLLLGVPNIRVDASTEYRAEIYFDAGTGEAAHSIDRDERAAASPGEAALAIDEARWYRGDFHTHSGHSDGVCAGPAGAREPCPIRHTLETATIRGLDFVSLTEHNTQSHTQEIATLGFGDEKVLVLPGVELTTFSGHANLYGNPASLDFPAVTRDLNRTFASWRAAGGLVSINHPGLPSDERCLGCGWTASVDARLIDAVEIVNGGVLRALGHRDEPARADVDFWESLLNAGHRVTGIGGSDNHDALAPNDEPGAIGRPITAVFARSHSAEGVLEAVRSGRVYIDLEGNGERLIDLTAVTVDAVSGSGIERMRAMMGEVLCAPKGAAIDLTVRVITELDDRVILIQDSAELAAVPLAAVDGSAVGTIRILHPGNNSWVRAESRSKDGAVRLLSNPVYLHCDLELAPDP